MSLKQRLVEQITLHGPITVADYMHQCLLDPEDGYYTRHVALGEDGDFITAPLVSQMFGEMIGVWVTEMWRNLGSPPRFQLVEIGGGDGTLMSDILRVAAKAGLGEHAEVVMIEPSPVLREQQAARLPQARFADTLSDISDDQPMILVANEVLDCLPARQFVRTDGGWHERCVGVRDGGLVFGLAEHPDFVPPFAAAPGEIIEISPVQAHFAVRLAEKLTATRGAALLIDYGRSERGAGDTLQALHRHQKHNPLAAPGHHDLTQWADFPTVTAAAVQTRVKSSAVISQAEFLQALGISARRDALTAKNPAQAAKIERQYQRLTAPDQMGELFKVIALAYPHHIDLTGLEA